jgi:hypothetical protein
MKKLVLAHHTISEWTEVRAQQARSLGCSERYITRLKAQLRAAYAAEPKEES